MIQEQAVYEAKLAVAPFKLEFAQVDRHTVYAIQQHAAERLVDRERIMLAGDAAHTHSSGTAQGMNTGMHDVVSLGWRRSGVLKGWDRQPVLANYSDEQKAVAEQLIENDRTTSGLIGGEKPESMQDRPEDTTKLVSEFYDKVTDFSLGLGVHYPRENLLNDGDHVNPPVKLLDEYRSLDASLAKPGLRRQSIIFQEVTENNGEFKVVIFAGKTGLTGSALEKLRAQVDKHKYGYVHAVEYVTIVEEVGLALDENLGVRKFGKAYRDIDGSAHFGRTVSRSFGGAIVVLRPDGIVGTSNLLKGVEERVVPYFDRLVIPRGAAKLTWPNGDGGVGELLNPFENNLIHSRKNAEMLA